MSSTAECMMNPNEDKEQILIVGSSRVRDLTWKKQQDFYISLVSRGGLEHQELIKVVDERINQKTKILILVCLQVELHSITRNINGMKGLV